MKVGEVDEASLRFGFVGLAARCISMGTVATFKDGSVETRPLGDFLDGGSIPETEVGAEHAI